MSPNPIALAVPFFFLAIGIDLLVSRRRGLASYRFTDSISDMSCGMIQRVLLLFFEALLLLVYVWFYERARLFDLGRYPILAWTLALVGADFVFYWWHRASHRVNALWAAHVVHHQSEDFNLAVALRQAVLTPLTHLPFSLALALLGVPPLAYATAEAINLLYQFWIHTESVRRLGPLEAVLNTPSHHRVHHARNPEYLDHNYGGILIVWDRLFGTYVPEGAAPAYGITKPLRSFNPVWAQLHYFADLWRLSRQAPTLSAAVRVWLAPPDRTPVFGTGARVPEAPDAAPAKYDVAVPPRLRAWVLVQFALAVVVTFAAMLWQSALPAPVSIAAAAFVVLSVTTACGLMEQRAWAKLAEAARLALVAVAALGWWLLG